VSIALLIALIVLLSSLPLSIRAQVPQLPRDQTLIVSQSWAVPSGFNPFIPGIAAWGSTFLQYPYLFVYSLLTDDYVPYLASSFKWVDLYTFEIKLKPDAYWWDKTPITAEDVVFSLEVHRMCNTPSSYIWMYIEGVEAKDPITVIIHVNRSNVNYFRVIDVLQWMIVPKHRWEKLYKEMGCKAFLEFPDNDPKQIIGGGPYRALFMVGDTWAYERVDDWWGIKYFGLPAPKYVMHIVPKSDEQVRMEWLAGNRDHMSHFVDRLWEIIKNPMFGTFDNEHCPPCMFADSIAILALNNEKYPLNDTRVRKAIYYALLANNSYALRTASEVGFSGYMRYNIYPVPVIPGNPRAERYLAKDLVEAFLKEATIENARKLLDEAGIIDRNGDGIRELPDGRPFKLTILCVTGWVPTIGSAQVWADYLRETLGIDARVETKDFSVVWSNVCNGEYEAAWWVMNTGRSPSTPWINFDVLMDSRLPTCPGQGPIFRYKNPEVIPILDEIGRTWDESKRMELFRKLQEIWLRDLPSLIVGTGVHWYQYYNGYWVGWPNRERVEKEGAWYATNWEPAFLFVIFEIKSAKEVPPGQLPPVPEFLKPHNRIPAAEFFEELGKLVLTTSPTTTVTTPPATTAPPPTTAMTTTVTTTVVVPTTILSTVVSTVSSVLTATLTATTTVTQRVTEWATTIAIAIALLIIGFAIGWIIKRK
jgi:peptide/nickel transport system substrate-binding protein